jgi:hypothetical protein
MEDDEYPDDIIRSAEAIARRAIVLSQVVAVAHGDAREAALAWLKREGLLSDLSPREQDFLSTNEPSRSDVIGFTWGVERLVPLMWSIQKIGEMPPLTAQCDTDSLCAAMVWPPNSTAGFISSAQLRDEAEIRDEYEKIYDAHWRVRDARIHERPIPDCLDAGAIFERHWGFNWLTGYCGQEWDQISTDT